MAWCWNCGRDQSYGSGSCYSCGFELTVDREEAQDPDDGDEISPGEDNDSRYDDDETEWWQYVRSSSQGPKVKICVLPIFTFGTK